MNFLKRIPRIFERIQKINYTCEGCGKEVFSEGYFCKDCFANLPWNVGPYCPLCGRAGKEDGVCLECKGKRLFADRARSVWTHGEMTATIVSRLKNGAKYLRFLCAERLEECYLSHFTGTDLLAFVPMTKGAEKRRGYNQSRLLAEELSGRVGVPLYDGVIKQRETDAQKVLSRREREENLRGCFHVVKRKELRGKTVLIIDDTLTTGSTVSELSYTLKRAGAKEVNVLTLTSVPRKQIVKKAPKQDESVHTHQDETPTGL